MTETTSRETQIRGYMLKASGGYLREFAGADSKRIVSALTAPTREAMDNAKDAGWYPVAMLSETLNAVASLAKGNDEKGRELLVNCGASMAREATNTFLRILMRMLTPNLFAKKLPDLWTRDCSGGKLVVDVSDQKLSFTMTNIQGFDHAVCTGTGFALFALKSMGKVVKSTTIKGWSLATPSQEGCTAEIVWEL